MMSWSTDLRDRMDADALRAQATKEVMGQAVTIVGYGLIIAAAIVSGVVLLGMAVVWVLRIGG